MPTPLTTPRRAILLAAAILFPCLAWGQGARPARPGGGPPSRPAPSNPSTPASRPPILVRPAETPSAPAVAAAPVLVIRKADFTKAEIALQSAYKASLQAEKENKIDDAIQPLAELAAQETRGYAISVRLGWLHYLKGAHAVSEDHYRDAVRLAAGTVEGRVGLMAALLAQAKYEDAEAVGKQLAAIDPGNPTGMLRLCHAMRMQGKDDAALALASRMLAICPTDISFMAEKAYAHAARGDTEQARKLFRQVQVHAPDNAWAKEYLGRAD